MIVPVAFGRSFAGGSAITGMWATAIGFLTVGYLCCAAWPNAMQCGTFGGVVIALSQVIPILQILPGILAVSVTEAVGLAEPPNDQDLQTARTFAAGAVVTVITAVILLAIASLVGWAGRAVLRRRRA